MNSQLFFIFLLLISSCAGHDDQKTEPMTAPIKSPYHKEQIGRDIFFILQHDQSVTITICDVQGDTTAIINTSLLPPGEHKINWDGKMENGNEAKPGIYFASIVGEDIHKTVRLMHPPGTMSIQPVELE